MLFWWSFLGTNKFIGTGEELIIGADQVELVINDAPLAADAPDTFLKICLYGDFSSLLFFVEDEKMLLLEFGTLVLVRMSIRSSALALIGLKDDLRTSADKVDGRYTPLANSPSWLLSVFVASDGCVFRLGPWSFNSIREKKNVLFLQLKRLIFVFLNNPVVH